MGVSGGDPKFWKCQYVSNVLLPDVCACFMLTALSGVCDLTCGLWWVLHRSGLIGSVCVSVDT